MKRGSSVVFDTVKRQEPMLSRRDAVRSLGLMCASGPLRFADHLRMLARQESRRIDVHHHFFHPGAKQRFERFGPAPRIQGYSPESSLAAMDDAGIERAILSLPARLADEASAIGQGEIAFAREANEYAARIVSDYPGRFGFFAFLPLPDIDATLREIEYALDQLGASGVGLITSYGNRWLGHPDFRPVLEELDRRGALAYTHPYDAPCCRELQPNTIPQTVEWNTDTSRAIWSFINDGEERPGVTVPTPSAATVHSNVRFIWSHAGGSLLGLVGRFLGGDLSPVVDLPSSPLENSRLYHLRRFYYDTAGSVNRIQMPALVSLVGASQVLLGTDSPFHSAQEVVNELGEAGLQPSDIAQIERGNALRMLESA